MKILAIDIETTPNLVYTWGLFDQNIGLNQVVTPSEVLCFAAKWVGHKPVTFRSQWGGRPGPLLHGRRVEMIEEAWALLDEADVVIHWNGARFDIPHLQREFLLLGLGPTSSFVQVDLLKTARSRFKFLSNKLEHVSQQILGTGKVKHEGFDLWLKAWRDADPDAQKRMKKYNVQDTQLLDDLYFELQPWIVGLPNPALYGGDVDGCPKCGSTLLQKRGFRYTTTARYQQYWCCKCGAWSRDAKADKTGPKPTKRPA